MVLYSIVNNKLSRLNNGESHCSLRLRITSDVYLESELLLEPETNSKDSGSMEDSDPHHRSVLTYFSMGCSSDFYNTIPYK